MKRAVVTYCWPGPRGYQPKHVNAHAAMCKSHSPDIGYVCVTDGFDRSQFSADVQVVETPPEARALAKLASPEGARFPSSYRRLWTLSKKARALAEILFVLDIDCIVCGSLDGYFDRPERFVGWWPRSRWGAQCRFGGGTWLHRPGTLDDLWRDISADPGRAIAAARAAGYRGSDQAILSHRLVETEPYFEEPNGIYQAQDFKGGKTHPAARDYVHFQVPDDARILHFNGALKPWRSAAPFVRKLYRPYLNGATVNGC